MYKIGDFARLSRVPVKTLRYYDEIGLLKPTYIDRYTRYRYYSGEQLARLNRILVLKELGFSLEQIGSLLAENLTADQLKGMLILRRAEVEGQVRASRAQLSQIERRLRQLNEDGYQPKYEVVFKQVPACWVAAAGGSLGSYDQAESVLGELFGAVESHLSRLGVRPAGPPLALYHEAEGAGGMDRTPLEVEVALPLYNPIQGSKKVRVVELPAVERMAATVHSGPFSLLGEAYRSLWDWMQSNGLQPAGPAREVYLRYLPDGDPDQTVTEIQIPTRPKLKEMEMKEPKIVERDAFKAVGVRYLGKNENQEIARMWEEFGPRIQYIQNIAPGDEICTGLCFPNEHGLVDYMAAFKVTRVAGIPQGMESAEVPAQTYAVFELHGVKEIPGTYHYILEEWMPHSGYQPGNGPDFEMYPESFDVKDPDTLMYIYFPVVK